jgi:hypothetical protein
MQRMPPLDRLAITAIVAVACAVADVGCRKVVAPAEQAEATSHTSAAVAATPTATAPAPADASAAVSTDPRFSLNAGTLSVERHGSATTIADGVEGFWPVALDVRSDGGAHAANAVAYARADGAGGYENEGQSLYIWAPGYKDGRKVLAEYFQIQSVEALAARSGRTVLEVVMRDGGLGATHVAFADPDHGELYRADGAEVIRRDAGSVWVGSFRDEDWEVLAQDAGTVHPVRTERFDLDALLRRPVMHNPRQP